MILCIIMITLMLPVTAFAEGDDKAIMAGADGIKANDKVYFGKYGTYDVPWFVLSVDSGSAFLLSEYLLGQSSFQTYDSGYYKGGALNAKMDDLYNGTNSLFTVTERSTITAKTNLSCVDGVIDDTNSPAVPTAHLYPLSYNEAKAQGWASDVLKARYRDTDSIGWWWLRSSINDLSAFCMNDNGHGDGPYVDCTHGVRPACNLDLSKVLFTSAADNSGQNATLAAPADYSGNEWKVTLKDENSFAEGASVNKATVAPGETLQVTHKALSGFTDMGYTNVTAAISDGDGKLLYYGSVGSEPDATASDVTIPAELAEGTYNLSLYGEDWNDEKLTNYATGTPFTAAITVNKAATTGENAIQLGTGGIKANDKVYFGKYTKDGTDYDVPWIVLLSTTLSETSVVSGTNALPLLSEYLLGDSLFRADGDRGYYNFETANNTADSSILKETLEGYYNGVNSLFVATERNAVADTELTGNSMYAGQAALSGQKLFPLSYTEAESLTWGSPILQAKYRHDGSSDYWWLRSSNDYVDTYCVDDDGLEDWILMDNNNGVRPACNLDLSGVLFLSAAVDGKPEGGLQAVPDCSGSEWKLKLLDSARSRFSIATRDLSNTSATVDYSGAQTGTNEYISAMIVDNGSVAYYGRIKSLPNTSDAYGTVTINIPAGVTLDADTQLKVFNEQFNGDRSAADASRMAYTDYASELKTVTAPVPCNIAPTASAVSVTGTPEVGKMLTGSYTYGDADGDIEGTSIFQWYRADNASELNKTVIPGANAKTYALTSADEGKYISFEVTPVAQTGITRGDAVESASICVNAPDPIDNLRITRHPANANAYVGETATFTVEAAGGTTPYRYQWQIVMGDDFENISGATNASYSISAVTMGNDGYKYRCTISDCAGTIVTSNTATLSVDENIEIPKTGDDSRPALWLGLMVLSLGSLIIPAIIRKRRNM